VPSQILTELLIIVALLMCNGVFAMSELAVVTARRTRLARRAEAGDTRAQAALDLAAEPTQFLSTVQVGITLVGTFAGAFGGATIAEELTPVLASVPVIGPYAGGVALGLVVAVITFLSVVLGELVPKRVALGHPETIASWVARPMGRLARIGGPVVRLLTGSTELILRVFGFKVSSEPTVTEDDIRALVAQATASGAMHKAEQEILDRVLHLGDRPAAAIMTPRTEMAWVEASAGPEALRAGFAGGNTEEMLVCEGGVENVVGVVRAGDLLTRCLAGAVPHAREVVRQPLMVPETMPLLQLLTRLRQSGVGTAVVLDEFGGVEGMITVGDILGDLVSDLPARPGAEEPGIVRRPEGGWLIDGATPMEEVEEELALERPGDERRRGPRTLAGLVMAELGRLPVVGERVERWGYTFEVVDMDGRRIDRVLAAPVRPSAAGPPAP
jgi:putative hemolysin